MTILGIVIVLLLAAALTLASYLERIYEESGKLLAREFQTNIDFFSANVEPRLRGKRVGKEKRGAANVIGLLTQLLTAAIAMVLAYDTYAKGITVGEVVQAIVAMVLILVACNRVIPFLLFSRTTGAWMVPLIPLVRAMMLLISPVTLVLGFCMQVAALAEEPEKAPPETPAEAVDALIEAGEEEGILEGGDRELIQSVVEFGDKTVREVMTARPDIFAVPSSTTIAQLTELLRDNPKSRVPVYEGKLDRIQGIVFTHDLLQITDVDALAQTVASLLRPAYFVPETKWTSELLREMQHRKSQIAIVIDEYGGVAGLVTMEDLLEEIVGELHDERDTADVVKEKEDTYIVPGSMDIDRLDELFGIQPEDDDFEASTVGGLLSEALGRIPKSGETLDEWGFHFEVLESTDRRVESVRVSRAVASSDGERVNA